MLPLHSSRWHLIYRLVCHHEPKSQFPGHIWLSKNDHLDAIQYEAGSIFSHIMKSASSTRWSSTHWSFFPYNTGANKLTVFFTGQTIFRFMKRLWISKHFMSLKIGIITSCAVCCLGFQTSFAHQMRGTSSRKNMIKVRDRFCSFGKRLTFRSSSTSF